MRDVGYVRCPAETGSAGNNRQGGKLDGVWGGLKHSLHPQNISKYMKELIVIIFQDGENSEWYSTAKAKFILFSNGVQTLLMHNLP